MNTEKFKELISLLSLTQIQFIDSHETVLNEEPHQNGTDVQIKTEQSISKDDPIFKDNTLFFNPKYLFEFVTESRTFFKAEYIIMVVFDVKDVEKCKEILNDSEIMDFFISKQLHRTLWSILRGTVLDAFNRHSLKPIPLPLLS